LVYEVIPKKGKSTILDIAKLIKSKFARQCGIIYCMTKKECDNTAMLMSREGIKAVSYHAGLTDKKRNDVQMQWTSNITNVRFVYYRNIIKFYTIYSVLNIYFR